MTESEQQREKDGQGPGTRAACDDNVTLATAAVDSATTPNTNSQLPVLHTARSPDSIIAALDAAARRGKLAGFQRAKGDRAFRVVDFGRPFESRLFGTIEDIHGTPGTTRRIVFSTRLKLFMPIVFAVMLIVSVWPGILLTDSMLKLYFSWYTIPTWWWYLPLTVPFVPFAFMKAWKTSRASGIAEAHEIIQSIAKAVS